MKSGIRIAAVLLIGLLLTGCSNKAGEETGDGAVSRPEGDTETAEEGDAAAEGGAGAGLFVPERYIEWLVPDIMYVSEATLSRLNEMLSERGCDFGLTVTEIDFMEYSNLLLDGGYSPDIAFAGLGETTAEEVIASGYFECLDSLLVDSALYSVISEKLWDSVRYGGSIHTIPAGAALNAGINIYFNLEKVSPEQAESFTGDLSELSEILGEDGVLLFGMDALSIMEYYGYSCKNGILVSPEKEVSLALENEKELELLGFLNELWLEKRVTTDGRSKDWSVGIVGTDRPLAESAVCYYSAKDILYTRLSCSTGIAKASENKEEAFRFLELLHTDSELANCLIYGPDYAEKEGYAVDQEGNVLSAFTKRLVFGVNESVLWDDAAANYTVSFRSSAEKIQYYEEHVIESPLLDLYFETDVTEIESILAQCNEIWKSEDLDGRIAAVKQDLEAAGISELLEEIRAALGGEASNGA